MTEYDHRSSAERRSALREKSWYVLRKGAALSVYIVFVITGASLSRLPADERIGMLLGLVVIIVGMDVYLKVGYFLDVQSLRSVRELLAETVHIVRNEIAAERCRNAGLTEGAWIDDLDRGRCQLETLTPEVTVTTADGATITIGTAVDLLHEYRYRRIEPIKPQQPETTHLFQTLDLRPLILLTILGIVLVGLYQLV